MQDRNANRPGYKKTKAGWIPKDWDCAPAGALFDIQLGKMLNNKARNGNNPKPYLANYNVRWGEFDLSEVQRMSFYEKELYKFELQQGDLLVCEGGEVGRCAVWEEQIKPCYFQKALHRVRPSTEKIDVYFIMYYLHFAVSSPMMVNYVSQTSISHFTREQFLKFPIALPPLPEQKKIAEILLAWDNRINQTRKLITAKKNYKKAIMQQVLAGQTRLPGFSREWRSFQFKDLAEIIFSNVDKKKSSKELPVKLCNYLDVYRNRRIDKSYPFMMGTVRKNELEKYKLHKDDVIITKDSETVQDIAVPCYVAEEIDNLVCGYHLAIVRPDPRMACGPFLAYLLASEKVHYRFARIANGVTRFGLPLNAVKNIDISIPCLKEQHCLAEMLSTIDLEKTSLERKTRVHAKQKRGLMQKLLTGEVRVKT